MLNWRPYSPYYLSGVHIHRIIYANTRKRDFEKHAKTGEFHSSMRASELTAPPGSRRNTNYQLRMPLTDRGEHGKSKHWINGVETQASGGMR